MRSFGPIMSSMSSEVSIPVDVDGETITEGITLGGSSVTFAKTVSGDNRYLAVNAVWNTSFLGLSSITYNGDALSLKRKLVLEEFENSWIGVEQWGLINPDVGSFNVVMTMGEAGTGYATAINFINVNQTTPTSGASDNTNFGVYNNTDPTVTISSTTDDMVLDCCMLRDNMTSADITVGAGQTERASEAVTNELIVKTSTEPGATSVTMSYTLSGWVPFVGIYWMIVALNIKKA